MSGLAVAAKKVLITLTSHDQIRNERTITTYDGVVNDLLKSSVASTVILTAAKEFWNFNQGPLTPWDFPKIYGIWP